MPMVTTATPMMTHTSVVETPSTEPNTVASTDRLTFA